MYKSTGKPSIPKFRSRLERIVECSDTGYDLANWWNPKGRNTQMQSELMRFFSETSKRAAELHIKLNGRRI